MKTYKRDPIAEAICEFRFVESADWDLTVPGRLFNEVRDQYPGKPINQTVAEIEINQTEPSSAGAVRVKPSVFRVQLRSADGSRILSVGPHQLSIHLRRPYMPGWEADFRPRIESALRAYRSITDPKAVSRVGLRYLNQIVIPEARIALEQYFNVAPRDLETLPRLMTSFFLRTEQKYPDGTKLLTTFASADELSDGAAFLLDLDTIWDISEVPLDDAVGKADELHEKQRAAFEAMITDRVRKVLNGD